MEPRRRPEGAVHSGLALSGEHLPPRNFHVGVRRRLCRDTDIVAAFCSLTAGIGLEKRWKPEGPQRSAVHDSAAQWTCLRQSRLQMQKLHRYRERTPRKL